MAEPVADALQRTAGEPGIVIVEQDQDIRFDADFGERCDDAARDDRPERDQSPRLRRAPGRQIDQVRIAEARRAKNDLACDFRLVLRERKNDGPGRRRACGKRLGQRQPDTRRWIVEQEGHRHFGGVPVDIDHLRGAVGPAERTGGTGAIPGLCRFNPTKECLYDHRRLDTST